MLDRLNPNDQVLLLFALVLAFVIGLWLASAMYHGAAQVDRSRDVYVTGDRNTVIVTDIRPQVGLFNGD